MPKKAKGKDAESAEYKAFSELAKKVLSVPKTELDKRETEFKKRSEPPTKKA